MSFHCQKQNRLFLLKQIFVQYALPQLHRQFSRWFDDSVEGMVNDKQFGWMRGISTTDALVDMMSSRL